MRLRSLIVATVAACGGGPSSGPDATGVDSDAAGPVAHCHATGPLPTWATAPAPATLAVQLPGVALEVIGRADGIAELRYVAAGEIRRERPWTALTRPGPDLAATVGGDGDAAELCTPSLAVTVERDGRVAIRDDDGHVLVDDGPTGGFTAGRGGATLARRAPADEHVYGLGERTGRLDRRGRRLISWNTDAYDPALGGYRPDADPLYLAVPFQIGLRAGVAHGVLTDDTGRLEHDLAATTPELQTVHTPARTLTQLVIAGPSIREVLRRYTALTGRAPLPPRWALGYHQSRWGYAPAARLTELARGFRARGVPADGLWLDIQHLRGFRTFTFDPTTFPDPAGLTAALAADGFALTVIADPGIKIDPGWDVYDVGAVGNHFLRTPRGAIFQGAAWPGPSAFPDFTRAATRAWWGAHVGGLAARGVRGVWLDVNEPTTFPEGGGGATVPDDLPVRGDADATMAEVHGAYARLEAEATWTGLRDAAPDRRPFVLSRAGGAGIQRWAAVWTGDTPSTWAGLRGTLPMLLGLGLSGVPFVGSDVGGYSGGATPELFARWLALGAASPFFRGHVTQGARDQEPWTFGPEVEEIARRAISERYRRLPYLYALFAEAEATGVPVLRPMVLEFQDDPATWTLDDQAMLGPWLLVAPVTDPGATMRRVYLPAGRWFEARSGAVFEGPTTVEVGVTLQALPTFVRAGAIVPGWSRGAAIAHTAAAGADGAPLELEVYPAGAAASAWELYEDAGDGPAYLAGDHRRVQYRLEPRADGVTLRAARTGGTRPATARALLVRVRRVDHAATAVRLDGAAVPARADRAALVAAGDGWWWDPDDLALWIALADRDAFTLDADYDPALVDARPRVRVAFEVRVPASTPADAVIHVASSASGWVHQPLARVDSTTARGTIEVERGAWFDYKLSRGGWDTVEKDGACGEITNRYRFGAADDAQVDVVVRWRDGCP